MRLVTATRAASILFRLAGSLPRESGVFLVPANACPVVPLALLEAGHAIEFLDLDNDFSAMSQNLLQQRLRAPGLKPVAGIVFIRPYGAIEDSAVDFAALRRISSATLMIDDRCASRPATEIGPANDSAADMYLYSTGYGKYVDLQVGGYAFISPDLKYDENLTPKLNFRQEHYQRLESQWKRLLASHQCKQPGAIMAEPGGWLDTGQLKLSNDDYLDQVNKHAESVATHKALADQIYRSYIPDGVFMGEQYNSWRHQILVENKASLLQAIFANRLFASGHYDTTARLFTNSDFPRSDHLYSRVINLFNDFHISEQQMIAVARLVRQHLLQ